MRNLALKISEIFHHQQSKWTIRQKMDKYGWEAVYVISNDVENCCYEPDEIVVTQLGSDRNRAEAMFKNMVAEDCGFAVLKSLTKAFLESVEEKWKR